MLATYATLTIAYSLYLKKKLFVDVLVLAGLFTHGVLSGAVAADVRLQGTPPIHSLIHNCRLYLDVP